MKKLFERIAEISDETTHYVFVDKRIVKNKAIIKALNIISLVISILVIVSQAINRIYTGEWYLWKDVNLGGEYISCIVSYFLWLVVIPEMILAFSMFFNRILLRIDSAKIHECIKFKDYSNLDSARIKILNCSDKIIIFTPFILDVACAFFFAMCYSAFFTNGYFAIIFGRYLGSFVGAHLCSYITIIFYARCCNFKKKELRQELPTYIANKKKELLEKQKAEKIANDKILTQKLLEQCGMKFFIKYYNQIKKLPIRDIDVEEDYAPTERTERLQAVKAIIDSGYSAIASDYILKNYLDILNDDEKEQLNSIS